MSVKIVFNFIGTRHVRSSIDNIISLCSGYIQGEFGIPGFRWGFYTNFDIGGVTLVCFCVGCSSSLQLLGKVIIPLSKCKHILAETLRVDVGGNKCEAPPIDKSFLQEHGAKTLSM